jgi:hypothetical protein
MNTNLENAMRGYLDGSGLGSTLEYTARLRQHLKTIFVDFNIKTLLDAPCGHLVWMSEVLKENPNINYIGGEILKPMVDRHTTTYKDNPSLNFIHLDITEDPLPDCDLWIVRDVLFHLSHENIFKAFKNMLRSNIKYILTTSHGPDSFGYNGIQWSYNIPIKDGGFDLLNLFAEPFCFPEPLLRFDDTFGPHPKREMCIWSKEQIANLAFNKT